jgi:subtilase family serine protease
VSALAAGASETASTTVTIPSTATTGNYNILAVADGAGVVGEAQENNNTRATPVQLGGDLALMAVSAPTAGAAGTSIQVTDTTRNQGSSAIGASTTGFYLSVDIFFDPSDVALGSRSVPDLAAGAASTATTTVGLPASTAPGTYYLLAVADAPNVLVETAEWNNVKGTSIVIGGDLTVTASSAPGSAPAGSTITVTDTTMNKGMSAVGATTTRVYLSSNNYWVDPNDVMVGARDVPSLTPNGSSAGSISVVIPANLPPGGYYMIVKADADGVVAEGQETNNERFMWIQIGPPQ